MSTTTEQKPAQANVNAADKAKADKAKADAARVAIKATILAIVEEAQEFGKKLRGLDKATQDALYVHLGEMAKANPVEAGYLPQSALAIHVLSADSLSMSYNRRQELATHANNGAEGCKSLPFKIDAKGATNAQGKIAVRIGKGSKIDVV